jgi:hypothetical protein
MHPNHRSPNVIAATDELAAVESSIAAVTDQQNSVER